MQGREFHPTTNFHCASEICMTTDFDALLPGTIDYLGMSRLNAQSDNDLKFQVNIKTRELNHEHTTER